MLQEQVPEWIVNATLNATPQFETQEEWADYIDSRIWESMLESLQRPREVEHPNLCPLCRSHLNDDCICDFCGFGEDEELYDALKSAENLHEAYAEY